MVCSLCGKNMEKYPAGISFYVAGKKVSIRNYPYHVCPRCAHISIKRGDMRKTVSFLEKHSEQMSLIDRIYFS